MGNIISFPGLGIPEFRLNPVAFTVFGHNIMWYGIIITLAMVAGFFVALHHAKKYEHISTDDVLDLAIFLIIFSMVGARLYYVLMKLENYHSFLDVIAVWRGGLAIYGGVIAGAITVFVVSKVKKISVTKMLDMVSPGLIIGQVIGRWGNFCNAEAHGTETKLLWRMGIQYSGSTVMRYYHPTFLYESLWNLLGFILISIFYKKKRYNGQVALWYITWYGFGRFFIEGLRTDSLTFTMIGTEIRISQVVAVLCVIAGIILMVVGHGKARDREMDFEDYDRVYQPSMAGGDSPVPALDDEDEHFSVKKAEDAAAEDAEETEPEKDVSDGTEASGDEQSENGQEDNHGTDH